MGALSTDLSNGMNITTLLGEDVTVDLNNGGVKINDATVVGADVLASNGVIHVLNQVLVPPSIDVGAFMQTCTITFVGVFVSGATAPTTEEISSPVPVTSSASKRNSWSLVTTMTTMIMTSVVVVALTTSVL